MSFNEEMPLLSEQELRTHDVRVYRPHTTVKKPAFDWDALTPTCNSCGQKSGQLNSDSICPTCRAPEPPQQEASIGQPTTRRSAPRAIKASSSPRRARGAGASAPRKTRPARREKRPARVGRPPTAYDVDAIVEAYLGGQTCQSIAEALQMGRNKVRAILRDADVEMRPREGQHTGSPRERRQAAGGRPRRAYDVDAIVEAYQGGQSIQSIADALAAARTKIKSILLDAGVEIRNPKGGGSGAHRGLPVDESAIVDEYGAGASAPQLAEKYSTTPTRVRRILERHGMHLRDDRTTNSGSKPKEYDPELCLAVEQLYVQEQLSQTQVAERLGVSRKVVENVMHRRGVRARQGESGHSDGAIGLRSQIERMNVLPRTIKLWALQTGLVDRITPGYPSQTMVDAYEAAHGGESR